MSHGEKISSGVFFNDKAIVTYFTLCIACSVLDLEEIIIVKKINIY